MNDALVYRGDELKRERRLDEVLRACNGDISDRGLRLVGIGSKTAERIVNRLRELDVVRLAGPYKRRTLVRSVDEVLALVKGETIAACAPRSDRGKRHRVPVQNEMRLLYDPGGLFAPGAIFPTDQVLPRTWAPDEPDQWYIGTRFERRGNMREIYVYDGERVRRED